MTKITLVPFIWGIKDIFAFVVFFQYWEGTCDPNTSCYKTWTLWSKSLNTHAIVPMASHRIVLFIGEMSIIHNTGKNVLYSFSISSFSVKCWQPLIYDILWRTQEMTRISINLPIYFRSQARDVWKKYTCQSILFEVIQWVLIIIQSSTSN